MPLEPSEMNPAMSPDMSAPAQGFDLPNGQPDHEGAMAKADLYKLANYSLKLFKKMDESTQLESWVQAKITKAADYMASVYHYLEYEMKFSEYGHHLDNSDTLNEAQKMRIKELLAEAKSKMKELKKQDAEKSKKVEEGILSGGERACTECGGSGMVYEEPKAVPGHVKSKVEKYNRLTKATHAAAKRLDRNNNGIPDDEEFSEEQGELKKTGDSKKTRTGTLTKTDTGVKHTNTSYHDDGDEISSNAKSGKGVKSHAKSQSASEKKDRAPALKQSPKSAKTWGMKDGSKFDNRDGAPAKPKKEKEVDEGMVGQGVYEAKKKGDGNLANNAKPYDKVTRGDVIAGRLGKDEKGGKTVKEAAKPSAGLSKEKKSEVVKDAKAGKDIGKPGKSFDKVAAKAGGGEKGKKIAAAAMWKNIKETTAYLEEKKAAVKDLPGNQEKIDADHDGKIEKSDLAALRANKKETVKESTEFTRMQEQLGRLNRNENIQVTESSEVAQLRKLTKLLG
jgi:hypothetical protein